MHDTDFEMSLGAAREDWLRVRFRTVGGRVVIYTVQYETTIGGKRVPVVRFVNAHGFPHRDLFDRNGRVIDKRPIAGNPDPGAALTQAQREVQTNWQRYRAAFFGEDHD